MAGPGSPFSSFFTIDSPALTFTPRDNFQFTQLDVAAAYVGTGANTLTVDLRADASFLPGAVLETWTVNGLPTVRDCCALQSLTYAAGTAAGPVLLQAGSQYWVTMSGGNGTFAVWLSNNTGVRGLFEADFGSGFEEVTFDITGAFAVQGTPTPEPATWQLAGLAMLTVCFALRKRGKYANR